MTGGRLSENLIINDSLKAKALRALYPGWGWCTWCGVPWARCDHHTTQITETLGMFPLCTQCWDALNVEDKLYAYRTYLLDIESLDEWPQVKTALLKELSEGGETVAP